MLIRSLLAVLCALLLAGPARAATTACPAHFLGGQAPEARNPKLAVRFRALCYMAFAVGHSGQSRTPLWSAERLTRAGVEAARRLPRRGTFHPDPSLPAEDAATLRDYQGSGYDRGHMSPSGDMPTPEAQQESFSLANMVPQAPLLNRELWEEIESGVRGWASRSGELFVVTGPVFQGQNLQALNGRVLVPTALFKAVYDPAAGRAGVYLVRNANDSDYRAISVAELTTLAGIDVFPAVPAAVKANVIDLPKPVPNGRRGQPGPRPQARGGGTPSDMAGWLELLRSLKRELTR